MPLSSNTVYMPNSAINTKECLDKKSILLRLIGVMRKEGDIADFVKCNWKPRQAFRVTRVNRQPYKINFYCAKDFDRVRTMK